MRYSDIAMQILAAKECGIIKSNAKFWKLQKDSKDFNELLSRSQEIQDMIARICEQNLFLKDDEGFICAYDKDFPIINVNAKNSDKPYLIFYKGDISLLRNLNSNVAVIGHISPTDDVENRERVVVNQLVKNNLNIVSGLAKGCDAIAHRGCLESGGKTIAILPTTLQKISPAVNRKLAEDIVKDGGLLLTEYYREPKGRQETIKRYIERDRLQALFSKAIILIASYKKDEGDSGSRHAMESARQFDIPRYVMYNAEMDTEDKQFGLNKQLLADETNIKILSKTSIEEIKIVDNVLLDRESEVCSGIQIKLF